MQATRKGTIVSSIDLESFISDIPDYPEPGVIFKDITPLISSPVGLAAAIDALSDHFLGKGITKVLGAEVVLHGDVYDDAEAHAHALAQEHGYTFIHPFDDPDVATGQGTIAMEIIKDLPLVDIILVPVGGGGLATGVSTLAKLLKPNVKVIAVEPEGAACLKASLEAGEVVTLPAVNTIADGTAVKTPGSRIFPYLQQKRYSEKKLKA